MSILKKHVTNIQKTGYTIIRNGFTNDLANTVIKEFDEWSSNPDNNFIPFSNKKVMNFHIHSKNTLDLVTNSYVNKIVSSLLNKNQVVCASTISRESIPFPYHRDTPHFYTNPIDQFYGVRYILEDVDINSGPIKYYIGSHTIGEVNNHEIFNFIHSDDTDVNLNTDFRCILEYNKIIENKCKSLKLTEVNEKNYIKLYKGDIIIWHPKLVHGMCDILDKTLTQYNMVTYNIPINTASFDVKHFFSKLPTDEYEKNECSFKYINHNDINIVDYNIGPICC